MCYDIKTSKKAQLERIRRAQDLLALEEIEERLLPLTDLPLHHASGFNHPEVLIYTDRSPNFPEVATWGLVPHWVKDTTQKKQLWNKTLNARGETIFEKPSFRDSAIHKRCLFYVDGFYEHHHYNGQVYPFYIHKTDNTAMAMAGLWNTWEDPETGGHLNTFSIVTTKGNALLSKIHNNPKLEGPRMPLILPENLADQWITNVDDHLDEQIITSLIQPYPDGEFSAHTVQKLRGKAYLGNTPSTSEPVIYNELNF